LTEAYAAARLSGAPHAIYGTCGLTSLQSLLLMRILPPQWGKVNIADTLAGMFRTGFSGYFCIIQM